MRTPLAPRAPGAPRTDKTTGISNQHRYTHHPAKQLRGAPAKAEVVRPERDGRVGHVGAPVLHLGRVRGALSNTEKTMNTGIEFGIASEQRAATRFDKRQARIRHRADQTTSRDAQGESTQKQQRGCPQQQRILSDAPCPSCRRRGPCARTPGTCNTRASQTHERVSKQDTRRLIVTTRRGTSGKPAIKAGSRQAQRAC